MCWLLSKNLALSGLNSFCRQNKLASSGKNFTTCSNVKDRAKSFECFILPVATKPIFGLCAVWTIFWFTFSAQIASFLASALNNFLTGGIVSSVVLNAIGRLISGHCTSNSGSTLSLPITSIWVLFLSKRKMALFTSSVTRAALLATNSIYRNICSVSP